jgi:3-hydroxyisobutyrate dehydrogenase-like beta-hydroxyacid dehydrogenase
MSSISIIGTGNMARAIGALAVAGGNTVEVIGRDQSKVADLAKALGGATAAEFGAVPRRGIARAVMRRCTRPALIPRSIGER